MTQAESENLFNQFLTKGKFTLNGKEYSHGKNWEEAIEAMIPDDRKMRGKICYLSSELTLTNRDMDGDIHEGFTIGRGKKLYWYLIWHSSGHVTVINDQNSRRW